MLRAEPVSRRFQLGLRKMDDYTAFMRLILSNAQSDLSPLERGFHALEATGKGESVAAYAKRIGRQQQRVNDEVSAARVAKVTAQAVASLLECTKHLIVIHTAPEHCWQALVERLIQHGWTVKETEEQVSKVRPTWRGAI
jgi:hypothetical protein